MQEKHLYEYAIIRVMPRVERGEFLNVGAVVYCKKLNYISCAFSLDTARLLCLYKEIDIEQLRTYLQAFQNIAEGNPGAGPIAGLDAASRFRWLTATRSTIIQTSPIHPAFCLDIITALDNLMAEFVQ
jgi:hypothetical protein